MGVRFQPPSRSFTLRDYQFIAVVVVLFLVVTTSLVLINLRLEDGGGEFYLHWVGSRAFFFDRIEPYGGEVAARTQILVYGGPAPNGSEPYILSTPFHLLPLFFPFSLFPNPAVGRAIFTAVLELTALALAFFSLRLSDWEAPRYFSALFILFGISNYYSIQALLEGSPVLLLGLIYAGILLSLRAETDELTGALIALSFHFWEVGAPFLFLVVLRVYHEKRVGVLAGFLMLTSLLLAVSFFLYPGWIIPFVRATLSNLRADFGFSILSIFVSHWPSVGRSIGWLLVLGLLLVLGFEWSAAARSLDFRRFYWACCLTLAATPLLGFRTEMEYLAVLVLPLALIFAVVHDRWQKNGGVLTALLLLLIFAVPWLVHFLASDRFGKTAGEMSFLFLPIFTVVGLYWIRWWAIHPPRTWRDVADRS